MIATKAGLLRTGPDVWIPLGFPAYLRQEAELSLRRLGVETIDLFQLHRIDDKFPLEDQIGELVKLQEEGKIRHIGLSEINVDQLHAAQKIAQIVSVQNLYNLTNRTAEPLLDEVDQHRGSASFRGSRWPPARSRARTVRWPSSAPSTAMRRPRSWRWPGC